MSMTTFGLLLPLSVALALSVLAGPGRLHAATLPTSAASAPRIQAQIKPVDPGPTKGGGVAVDALPIACRALYSRSSAVPAYVINAALEDPINVSGWNQLAFPGKPASPFNTPRRSLTLLNVNKPYQPLGNTLVFRSGCN